MKHSNMLKELHSLWADGNPGDVDLDIDGPMLVDRFWTKKLPTQDASALLSVALAALEKMRLAKAIGNAEAEIMCCVLMAAYNMGRQRGAKHIDKDTDELIPTNPLRRKRSRLRHPWQQS